MKLRQDVLRCQMEVVGVLARHIPTRLVEISLSGCLLESGHRIDEGTVGALQFEFRGQMYSEDVRATRCTAVAGSGANYLVGVEFLRTGKPEDKSIRRAVSNVLQGMNGSRLG